MKVLFLTTCYKRSKDCFTMAPWLHILARNMVRRGIDVKVLAPTDYGSKNIEIIDGVEIGRLDFRVVSDHQFPVSIEEFLA